MKSASAMKYGGELVDAVDCDYDSFKELIPLCPNCKEPVFLRTGGQRESVKGKAYQIGPHWSHFKGISKEQVAGCELRVNGYTEQDRAKIAAQARGQRLKLLQRWFWQVFKDNLTTTFRIPKSEIEANFEVIEKSLLGTGRPIEYPMLCSTEWIDASPFEVKEKQYDEVWEYVFKETNEAPLNAALYLPCVPDFVDSVRHYWGEKRESVCSHYDGYIQSATFLPSDIDVLLHKKIMIEIHSFLMSAKSRSILGSTMALTILKMSCNSVTGGWFSRQMCDGYHPADVMTSALALAICIIPWASEFQRLEAEAKQRKGAA